MITKRNILAWYWSQDVNKYPHMRVTPLSKIWGVCFKHTKKEKGLGTPIAKASHTGYPIHLVHVKHIKTCSARGIYKLKRIISICFIVSEVKVFYFLHQSSHLIPIAILQAPPIWNKHAWFSREEKERMFSSWPLSLRILKCFLSYVQIKKNNNLKIRKLSCLSSKQYKQGQL